MFSLLGTHTYTNKRFISVSQCSMFFILGVQYTLTTANPLNQCAQSQLPNAAHEQQQGLQIRVNNVYACALKHAHRCYSVSHQSELISTENCD